MEEATTSASKSGGRRSVAVGLADLLAPDTESADYGEHPRYWRYQDIDVEVHRLGDGKHEGILRINGTPMLRYSYYYPRLVRELEGSITALRPNLREVLGLPGPDAPKNALQRVADGVLD